MGQPSQPILDPLVGTTLGRYRIHARLGEGGMGCVYRAEQVPLGRAVALKVIHRSLLKEDRIARRFLREAKIACSLTNPNTVTVYDFGEAEDGTLYLAMELLAGDSLHERLVRDGRIPPADAAEIAAQVCRSLMEAHRKGIIHRDLKPENIFLAATDDGALLVKVLDYGLARIVSDDDAAPQTLLTQIGSIVGTPHYMSPEQARGKTVDRRTDLYSMGVVLFEMLTGVPPFNDEDAIVILSRHLKDPIPSLSSVGARVAAPRALEDLVGVLLAKAPEDRPAGALEVYQVLRDYLIAHTSRALPALVSDDSVSFKTIARLVTTREDSGVQARVPGPNETSDEETTAVQGTLLEHQAPPTPSGGLHPDFAIETQVTTRHGIASDEQHPTPFEDLPTLHPVRPPTFVGQLPTPWLPQPTRRGVAPASPLRMRLLLVGAALFAAVAVTMLILSLGEGHRGASPERAVVAPLPAGGPPPPSAPVAPSPPPPSLPRAPAPPVPAAAILPDAPDERTGAIEAPRPDPMVAPTPGPAPRRLPRRVRPPRGREGLVVGSDAIFGRRRPH